MTTIDTLRARFLASCFRSNSEKSTLTSDAAYRWGNDIATAWTNYSTHFLRLEEAKQRIEAFEQYLIDNDVKCSWSNNDKHGCLSNSRYYSYKGITYRFSDHVHPSGSMTNIYRYDGMLLGKIDLFADPFFIFVVKY